MRRPLRLFFRVVLVALLGLALLMGAAYWFLQRDPGGLVNRYLGEAARSHGLEFSMGAVDVSLLPSPSWAVTDVRVERPDLTLSVAYLTVRPDLFALLRGRFSPWSLTLVRPRLEARVDEALGKPEDLAERLRGLLGSGKGQAPPLGFLDGSCRLEITQGDARLTGADGAALALRGLQCRVKAAPPGEVAGSLQFTSLRYSVRDEPVASLERLRIEGESDLAAPLSATPDVKLGTTLHAGAWPGPVRLDLGFRGQPGGWHGSFALDSDLSLGSAAGELIPLRIAGTAAMASGARDMDLRGVNFSLGADSGRL